MPRIKTFPFRLAATAFAGLLSATPLLAQPAARLTVDVDKPGAAISPLLYGIFFEEINRAGDGGIYAEMVQNRSFEDAAFPLAWTLTKSRQAVAKLALDTSKPLNAKNPTSLRLDINEASGGRVGVVSNGFAGVPQRPRETPTEWLARFENESGGIAVERGKQYDFSLYARAAHFSGPLVVSLETQNGSVLALRTISGIDESWKKFTFPLTARATDAHARLVLSTTKPGTVWLDMVSLFPRDTWKGRRNGLRADLMSYIERLRPAFLRFPGGCFVEGDEIENAFRWKETIGDIAARPGRWNLWGYRSTDGLGYHEYLQMCEDLGAEPLFVINCGMSHHNGRSNAYAVPMENMGEWVQDALDAIEYANGPVTSKWGALRAQAGHPRPFNLKYLEIGNENGGPVYHERYALFHDAIKARYPQIQLVACDWSGVPRNRPLDIVDPHLYSNPQTMINQATRFDSYDRQGAKIYFGEYAVTSAAGTGNLQAAIAEAAFMTGLERNGDIVMMSSYAPLLSRLGWKAWNPNAIVFDQRQIYGTPSYHVQTMFGANRADIVLPVQIEQPPTPAEALRGRVGVGTWATQAEFKDIKVTAGDQTLFASDFSQGLNNTWRTTRGNWQVEDGVLRQTGSQEGARAFAGDVTWSDYTLTLKARKLSGNEGFLIMFRTPSDNAVSHWNLGGWGNTGHGLEVANVPLVQVPGRIETGRWYDIRVELQGTSIKCYLDGQLVHAVTQTSPSLYAVAGRDNTTAETVVKVVNVSEQPVETAVNLRGLGNVALTGNALVLTSANGLDENTLAAPDRVLPHTEPVRLTASSATRTFPARSVTILRLKSAR
ncbi:MAG TPA: alpha-L-arabinofuranosidase C-terminal domain-containing protein [Abditibacteriaceae bacterium]